MKTIINKKYMFTILVSVIAIPALVIFMQNCAKSSSAPVAVTADTPVVIVSTTTGEMNVAEGATANFSVSLNTQPSAPITMNLTSNSTGAVAVTPAVLNFTPANWATPQTIVLTGVEDDNVVNDDAVITAESIGLPTLSLTVHAIDNDTLSLYTSVNLINLIEGANSTFGVKLTAQPSADTTVLIGSPDTGAVTVLPTSINFTPANWNTLQTVTVSGVNDVDVADENVTLTVTSSGLVSSNINVHVTDDDVLTIMTDLSVITVSEGATQSLGVKLNAQPLATTTISLASANMAAATVSSSSLSFTTANWNTFQYVVISGVPDVNTNNESTNLLLTSSGITGKNISVTVVDTTPIIACGDGTTNGTEACDDGNTASGDGCSATCQVEASYMCSGSVPSICVHKFAEGVACGTDGVCTSGFCSDGVCCQARCGGVCEKCNQAGRQGYCDAIAAGTDPDSECTASAASTCGTTGQCNGSRACAQYSAGTVCAASYCSGNTAFAASTCNGIGSCLAGASALCTSSGLICVAGACQ